MITYLQIPAKLLDENYDPTVLGGDIARTVIISVNNVIPQPEVNGFLSTWVSSKKPS